MPTNSEDFLFKNPVNETQIKNFSIDDWKLWFSKELAGNYSTMLYSIDPKFLWRARPNFDSKKNRIDFFTHTKELWAPPHKKVKHLGRCNLIGQSLLYCSSNPNTTIFETQPDTGSELTIMEYKTKGSIGPLGALGVKEIIKSSDDYHKIFANHFQKCDFNNISLDDFVSTIFQILKTGKEQFNPYYLTNAITQIMLHKNKVSLIPDALVAPSAIGLVYPSVVTQKSMGANFLLEPASAKKWLTPNFAYKYRIIERIDRHRFIIEMTHKTSRIFENGTMAWGTITDRHVQHLTDIDLPLAEN